MSNSLRNDFNEFRVICPYCNSTLCYNFQTIDLYVQKKEENPFTIQINRIISRKPETEIYLRNFFINSLIKKPFIGRILLTKPFHYTIEELKKNGFLTNDDLKNIKSHQ